VAHDIGILANMDFSAAVATVPRSAWYAIAPFAILALILTLVRVYTVWNYHRSMRHIQTLHTRPGKKTIDPPQIPYTLPFLGNSLSFLNTKPGSFWQDVFSWHPRSSGACSLVLGGRKTHILFTPHVVASIFKDKTLKREVFEMDMYRNCFAFTDEHREQAMNSKQFEAEMNAAFLTRPERVNELTDEFMRVLDRVLSKDAEDITQKDSVGLYFWLRDRMFTASTTALFGDYFFDYYPDYCQDFYAFDQDFMSFMFGLPKISMREAHVRRERIINNIQAWSKAMHEKSGGSPIDPDNGPAWEPYLGSRLNRARQRNYKRVYPNDTARPAATLDLGITFALSSNVIPVTGWILMHILDPKGDPTLLGRVMTELKQAENPDGSVDVPTLINLPLMQSIWTETLRLYTDVLVTRNASQDTVLPLDEDGKTCIQLKKGDNVFAPTWIGHHDPEAWGDDEKAPVNTFHAERFLKPDPNNPGKMVFGMSSTGKFYPWGGGRTICPGRVFAKQEALGAVAIILLRFQFEVLGFVDQNGKACDEFVQPGKAFPGTAGLVPGGDMKVKMRKRERFD
jgi:cytochrome P450